MRRFRIADPPTLPLFTRPQTSSQDCCNAAKAKGYAGGTFDGDKSCWLKTAAEIAHPTRKRGATGCIVGGPNPGPAPPPPAPPPPPTPPPQPCPSITDPASCKASTTHCTWTSAGKCVPTPPKPPPPPKPTPCSCPGAACAACSKYAGIYFTPPPPPPPFAAVADTLLCLFAVLHLGAS